MSQILSHTFYTDEDGFGLINDAEEYLTSLIRDNVLIHWQITIIQEQNVKFLSIIIWYLILKSNFQVKACPRCQVLAVKMHDGSCNHMTCAVCGVEFCWLCMKEISDLHYLSPSGCTFWGKKPWSRKKKLLWQLGTLVGAPVGIALLA